LPELAYAAIYRGVVAGPGDPWVRETRSRVGSRNSNAQGRSYELHKGKHLLIDCQNVRREICLDDKAFLGVMARAAERAGATVISQLRYKFGHDSPAGFAAIIMLDESHCSAHTYADLGLIALDIFTCGNTDPQDVLRNIQEELDLGDVEVRTLPRFEVSRKAESQPASGREAWLV
jgi:S-adenosylmethionine decarboxylase